MRGVIPAWGVLLSALQLLASAHAASDPADHRWRPTHACASGQGEVFVPAGRYQPFFKRATRRPVPVAPMCLGSAPVTNGQYLDFVRGHPEWRKSRIATLMAEENYLANWRDDLAPPPGELSEPVTRVSWFAAGAYCESHGTRLPRVSEWERFAGTAAPADSHAPFTVAMGKPSADLAGTPLRLSGIWEWTEDFNSAVVAGSAGNVQGENASQFCGDGFRAVDPSDYAAFLRYSFRSSLRASYTLKNLGFRCTREAP